MPYEGEEGSETIQKGSFAIFVAEGDVLFKQGEYKKALESYSEALEIEPTDKNCLVARSKCHLQLGDAASALKDAEASLDEDKEYHKGLYQKAEALYQTGDFEMALVFYHRGNKLRPELQEFRLGIQKAQEAIDNSVGSPSKVKLENKGDLSFFNKQDEMKPTKKQHRIGYTKPGTKHTDNKQNKRPTRPEQSDKEKEITKQLLGDLYKDQLYLDKLLKDGDLTRSSTESGNQIYDLVMQGLRYLDTRTEFWRQQKPMYARNRDKAEASKGRRDKNKLPMDPAKYILKNLEEIDNSLAKNKPKEALSQSKRVLKTVEGWKESDVPDKDEYLANLHSCIGNAHLDLGNMEMALKHHDIDYDLCKSSGSDDGRSRALDNLGRVHARIGQFNEAVKYWKEKLPMVKSALEATWLYHEIGRCHLELGEFQEAHDFGEKSLKAAQEAGDDVWQLNASVLIAQSEVKLGDLHEAIESFERSLEMAKIQGDFPAQKAISKALEDLNEKIVKGLKGEDEDEEEENEEKKKDSDKSDDEKDKTDEKEDEKTDYKSEDDENGGDKQDDNEKVESKAESKHDSSSDESTKSDKSKDSGKSKKEIEET